ncbi:unnamed protein product [Polarella glacialis]|uniref:Fe2OG dioxygenase domain-containing protein n=1 Tax=Polarella glacialis TaxID=89957 RepID=A0A813GHY9_POLGL|nr:unnamed protein product [Polarella glacialis]
MVSWNRLLPQVSASTVPVVAALVAGALCERQQRRLRRPVRAESTLPGEAICPADLWLDYGVRRYVPAGKGRFALLCTDAAGEATEVDGARLKDMRGQQVPNERNPGLRAEPNFVDESEGLALEAECRLLMTQYGYSFAAEAVEILRMSAEGEVCKESQEGGQRAFSQRVTGRPEERDGELGKGAPWGYGSRFQVSEVPPTLQKVIRRVQESRFEVGAVRDLTINYRTSAFFKIDPHVDPLTDGPHVAIIGLLSGAVLTFTPAEASEPRRGIEVEQSSWTDDDIDVLVRKRSLVFLTGDARYKWKHAIRGGFELDIPSLGGPRICDFWGNMANILPRQQERISIVIAFADPSEDERR